MPIFTKVRSRRISRKRRRIVKIFTKVLRHSVTHIYAYIQAHLTLRLKQIIVSNRKELVVNTTRLLYVKLLKLVQLTAYFSLLFLFNFSTDHLF